MKNKSKLKNDEFIYKTIRPRALANCTQLPVAKVGLPSGSAAVEAKKTRKKQKHDWYNNSKVCINHRNEPDIED